MVIDIIVLLIVLASVLIAFLRGFIREVLTIIGIIGGLGAAYVGGPYFKPTMRGWLGVVEDAKPEDQDKLFDLIPYIYVADVLAYGTIFIVFVVILSFLSHFLAEFVSKIGLGAVDRTLGVVFGLARGLLLVGIIYLPVYANAGTEDKQKWMEGAKSASYLEAISGWIYGFVPEDMRNEVQKLSGEGNPAQKLLEAQELIGGTQSNDAGKGPEGETKPSGDGQKKTEEGGGGYSDKDRNAMDKLIEKQTQPPSGHNE
ncbi:MAG: CvpA family protein [Alphaproteobacteria bacterium]|nr:CvpA family protein [Alphaproteobacteria bacterium]